MIVLPVYRLVVRLFHFTVLINDIQTSNASFERTHIINILNFWIMKRIDNISEAYSHKLTAAPIDGKNVVEEALLEAVFDNSAFVSNKHEDSIGFINEWPASVHVAGNGLVLQFLTASHHRDAQGGREADRRCLQRHQYIRHTGVSRRRGGDTARLFLLRHTCTEPGGDNLLCS